MYTCINACVCTHICVTYVHTRTHTYIYRSMRVCVCARVYVRMHVHIPAVMIGLTRTENLISSQLPSRFGRLHRPPVVKRRCTTNSLPWLL